jgi:transposase
MVTQHVVGGRYAGTIFGGFAAAHSGSGGGGAPARSAAGRFEVSVSTAIRWAQLARGRSCRVAGDGGDHRSRLLEHRPAVLELLARQPDLTLPGSRHRTGRIAR